MPKRQAPTAGKSSRTKKSKAEKQTPAEKHREYDHEHVLLWSRGTQAVLLEKLFGELKPADAWGFTMELFPKMSAAHKFELFSTVLHSSQESQFAVLEQTAPSALPQVLGSQSDLWAAVWPRTWASWPRWIIRDNLVACLLPLVKKRPALFDTHAKDLSTLHDLFGWLARHAHGVALPVSGLGGPAALTHVAFDKTRGELRGSLRSSGGDDCAVFVSDLTQGRQKLFGPGFASLSLHDCAVARDCEVLRRLWPHLAGLVAPRGDDKIVFLEEPLQLQCVGKQGSQAKCKWTALDWGLKFEAILKPALVWRWTAIRALISLVPRIQSQMQAAIQAHFPKVLAGVTNSYLELLEPDFCVHNRRVKLPMDKSWDQIVVETLFA